jgi:hypothetical protein
LYDLARTPNNTNITYKPYAKNFNFINIDPRKIKFILLDSFYQDGSNKPKIIKIQSLNCLKIEVCKIRKFENIFNSDLILFLKPHPDPIPICSGNSDGNPDLKIYD